MTTLDGYITFSLTHSRWQPVLSSADHSAGQRSVPAADFENLQTHTHQCHSRQNTVTVTLKSNYYI